MDVSRNSHHHSVVIGSNRLCGSSIDGGCHGGRCSLPTPATPSFTTLCGRNQFLSPPEPAPTAPSTATTSTSTTTTVDAASHNLKASLRIHSPVYDLNGVTAVAESPPRWPRSLPFTAVAKKPHLYDNNTGHYHLPSCNNNNDYTNCSFTAYNRHVEHLYQPYCNGGDAVASTAICNGAIDGNDSGTFPMQSTPVSVPLYSQRPRRFSQKTPSLDGGGTVTAPFGGVRRRLSTVALAAAPPRRKVSNGVPTTIPMDEHSSEDNSHR